MNQMPHCLFVAALPKLLSGELRVPLALKELPVYG